MVELDLFFEKCIKSAFTAEKKEYKKDDVKWFYVVIKNQQLLFDIITPYQKVTNRIRYWVNQEVPKRFGLETSGDYVLSGTLQVNFVCKKIIAYNKCYYIDKYEDYSEMKEGDVIPAYKYEKLVLAYYGITLEEFASDIDKYRLPNLGWREFKELYKRAIGPFDNELITARRTNVHLL